MSVDNYCRNAILKKNVMGLRVLVLGLMLGNAPPAAASGEHCDLAGKELRHLTTIDAAACESQCRAQEACVGWTHVSGWNRCSLKSVVRRKVSLRISSAIKDPETGEMSSVEIGRDNSGKDMRRVSGVKDGIACAAECAGDVACKAVAFLDGYGDCWLKKTSGRSSPKNFSCGFKKE